MKEKFVCTFLLLLTLASCDRPDPSGVSRPASLPSATAPTAPPPTFTKTVTSTLTATATPEPTTTSTATPTPAPTATITASPRVEAIRKLVGDQPEDWFRWNEDIQGWEIWLIYPGEQSISQEPYEFSGADGKVIGKAWSWFTAEYLIGNQIRQLKLPYVWQNYLTGEYSVWIVPLGKDPKNWSGWAGWLRENYLTKDQKWRPGQVIEIYLNEPVTPGALNDTEKKVRIEAPHFFYEGKQLALDKLFHAGDPEIGMLLANITQMVCVDPYQAKTMFQCWREAEMIVIPDD